MKYLNILRKMILGLAVVLILFAITILLLDNTKSLNAQYYIDHEIEESSLEGLNLFESNNLLTPFTIEGKVHLLIKSNSIITPYVVWLYNDANLTWEKAAENKQLPKEFNR